MSKILLFNGSRVEFSRFDKVFYKSGEGVNPTAKEVWFFSAYIAGAFHHIRWIGALETGSINVCLIDDTFIAYDEGVNTDPGYGSTACVLIEHTNKIEVVESIPAKHLEPEVLGNYRKYRLAESRAPFNKSVHSSFLREG